MRTKSALNTGKYIRGMNLVPREQLRLAAKIITHNGTNNRWGNTWRIAYYLNISYLEASHLENQIYRAIMNDVA